MELIPPVQNYNPTGAPGGMQVGDDGLRRAPPASALKTKLCTKFMSGQGCPYGPNCNFAHGEQELREAASFTDPDVLAARKTRLCNKHFTPAGCPYGDRCNFAHEMKEGVQPPIPVRMQDGQFSVRVVEGDGPPQNMLVPEGNASSTATVAAATAAGGILMPFNFKTKICNKWQQGMCPFGAKCHFAHGNTELKARQPLPGGDVPGAPKGDWPGDLRALKNMASAPTLYMPPQAAALAALAAAANAGEYAYRANPYGDLLEDEEPPAASGEGEAAAARPAAGQQAPAMLEAPGPGPDAAPPAPSPPPPNFNPRAPPPSYPNQMPPHHQPPFAPNEGGPPAGAYGRGFPAGPGGMAGGGAGVGQMMMGAGAGPRGGHGGPPPGHPPGTGMPGMGPVGYKCALCMTFMQYGTCPYGDTCYDAHGEGELRR